MQCLGSIHTGCHSLIPNSRQVKTKTGHMTPLLLDLEVCSLLFTQLVMHFTVILRF